MRILLALEWYDHRIHRGVATVAREQGWHLTCTVGQPGADPVPAGWRGDGAVCLIADPNRWRRLRRACRKVVEVGLAPGQPDARVVVDNQAVGHLAAEHFRLRGFRSLACLTAPGSRMFDERETAFRQALAGEGIVPVLVELPPAGRTWTTRLRRLGRTLARLPRPVGVFAVQDGMAADAMLAAREAGLRVPDEVAILGVDDVELVCTTMPVPLSSIDTDQEGLGRAAALQLVAEAPRDLRWRPRGVSERASTAIIGSTSPLILDLLERVRRAPGLGVAELARALGITTQALDRACQHALGQPPGIILRRERLRRAGDALAGGASLAAAAQVAGLPAASGLCSLVRRELGVTPAAWRRQLRAAPSAHQNPPTLLRHALP